VLGKGMTLAKHCALFRHMPEALNTIYVVTGLIIRKSQYFRRWV